STGAADTHPELVVTDSAGVETNGAGSGSRVIANVAVVPGQYLVAVRGSESVAYTLETRLVQATPTITGVSPDHGAAGTTVQINASGFTTDPAQNIVLFGGVAAAVSTSSATQITVTVPALAVDGPITLISTNDSVEGPVFSVGRSGPAVVRILNPK